MPDGKAIVLGTGPKGLAQLTIESMQLLRGCDKVFAAAHQKEMRALCRRLRVPFADLDWGGEAPKGGARSSAQAVEAVLRAVRAGARAGLVVDGNPALFSLAERLSRLCREEDLACELRASVSSLDQILVALQARVGDVAARGLAAYNAHSFIDSKASPDTSLAVFLYNAGGLRRDAPKQWARLAARLRAVYGRRGKVFLIECASGRDAVVASSLDRLERDFKQVGVNATLCLPPAWY